MMLDYPGSFSLTSLNGILARFLDDEPAAPVDCAGCTRPSRCCDFQPFVANFLVGAALESGRRLPEPTWKFARQPLGLLPSAAFREGRATALPEFVCAFYREGRCDIWHHRPGECSVYNCVAEKPALSARTFAFETTLAQMALVELGYTDEQVRSQIDILNEPGERLVHEPDAELIYRRAWDWVRGLDRHSVAAWLEDV